KRLGEDGGTVKHRVDPEGAAAFFPAPMCKRAVRKTDRAAQQPVANRAGAADTPGFRPRSLQLRVHDRSGPVAAEIADDETRSRVARRDDRPGDFVAITGFVMMPGPKLCPIE